jgi:hypothetical protein
MQNQLDEISKYENIIIKIVTENWRLMQLFLKIISKLGNSEAMKYYNQVRYLKKVIDDNLQEINLRIVDLVGEFYDAGIAAIPVNLEDFNSNETLIIEQMIEPLIMSKNGVKKQGLISLAKVIDK